MELTLGPIAAPSDTGNVKMAIASGSAPIHTRLTNSSSRNDPPVEALIKRYSSLRDTVQKLNILEYLREITGISTGGWSGQATLDAIEKMDQKVQKRFKKIRPLTPTFAIFIRFLEAMEEFAGFPRESIWPVLLYVFSQTNDRIQIWEAFDPIMHRVGTIFEEALSIQQSVNSQQIGWSSSQVTRLVDSQLEPMVRLESCFLDLVTRLFEFVYTFARRKRLIAIQFKANNINDELEQDLLNMDQHLNNLRRLADLETRRLTTRLAMENVILTDQLKEYLSKWTQPQTQADKRRLEAPTGKNPEIDHPWHVDVGIVPDGFQSNTQPVPANRDDVNVLQGHPDGYVTYITAPLIGYLEHRRKFLSEGTSHEFINLFDRPKVASWIASNTSSFLWIEGYPTGAPLNFTTEFSLDVIHAAQARGYAVLYHFCELLALIEGMLQKKKGSHSAEETILKSLLWLAGSQYAHQFLSSFGKETLELQTIIDLQGKKTTALFRKCLKAFKPGTILYIVIDGVHNLEEQAGGRPRLKKWLKLLLSVAHDSKHVVKILFTSCRYDDTADTTFRDWEHDDYAEAQSSAQDAPRSTGTTKETHEVAKEGKASKLVSTQTIGSIVNSNSKARLPLPRSFDSIPEDKGSGTTRIFGSHLLLKAIKPIVHILASNPKASSEPATKSSHTVSPKSKSFKSKRSKRRDDSTESFSGSDFDTSGGEEQKVKLTSKGGKKKTVRRKAKGRKKKAPTTSESEDTEDSESP